MAIRELLASDVLVSIGSDQVPGGDAAPSGADYDVDVTVPMDQHLPNPWQSFPYTPIDPTPPVTYDAFSGGSASAVSDGAVLGGSAAAVGSDSINGGQA